LSSDSYKHKNKTFGRIYTPVFTVVKWHAQLPQAASKPAPAPVIPAKKVPAKKAAKPRKAA
jgi:hypothetical protein